MASTSEEPIAKASTHRETKLIPSWELSPCWPVFITLGYSTQTVRGENLSLDLPWVDPVCYKARHAYRWNGGRKAMGISNCFLFGFDVCSSGENIYMAGTVKFARIPIARVVSCCCDNGFSPYCGWGLGVYLEGTCLYSVKITVRNKHFGVTFHTMVKWNPSEFRDYLPHALPLQVAFWDWEENGP